MNENNNFSACRRVATQTLNKYLAEGDWENAKPLFLELKDRLDVADTIRLAILSGNKNIYNHLKEYGFEFTDEIKLEVALETASSCSYEGLKLLHEEFGVPLNTCYPEDRLAGGKTLLYCVLSQYGIHSSVEEAFKCMKYIIDNDEVSRLSNFPKEAFNAFAQTVKASDKESLDYEIDWFIDQGQIDGLVNID